MNTAARHTNPRSFEPPLPADSIMPPQETDSAPGTGFAGATANLPVLPILFVPSDLPPNPYGLRYIGQRLPLVWLSQSRAEVEAAVNEL